MSDNKYTSEDLRIMQSWPLERKIQVTQTRIIEWYQKNDGKVYVSFSGGKDSTVLLDLVRRIYPDVPAVFIDTGLEYPELREFVKTIQNVTWLKPEMNFRKVIEKYGYPVISKYVAEEIYNARKGGYGLERFDDDSEYNKKYGGRYSVSRWTWLKDSNIPISNKCCAEMKKKPVEKYEKETGNKVIVGTMACESRTRKTAWLKNGCNAFDSKRPISQPISFWTEQDVLHYIKEFNVPYCPVYGEIKVDDHPEFEGQMNWIDYLGCYEPQDRLTTTGCSRTGCMFCMFGVHLEKEPNRFQRMKVTHTKQYAYCMDKLGLRGVLEYIGVPYE